MKIDLHCHTRKIKSGDALSREVSCEKFITQLENAQVSIVAITNHNCFDYEQYKEFQSEAKRHNIQVWPGVELDVKGEQSSGHCIIIANPKYDKLFAGKCIELIDGINPDNYEIDIHNLIEEFQEFDITVIAHYAWKKPSLVEHDLNILRAKLRDKKPLFLEVSQLRSAGILYAHNITSFIGSDVQDWDNYANYQLPDLKMPICDYEHFNLLIKKDEQVLKTFINQKINERISISPFEDCSLELPIYNDVNIIFGGKGTGKSSFLKKLKEYFDSRGNNDVSYYEGQINDSNFKKMTCVENEESDFFEFGINDCSEEIDEIKKWADTSVTPISKYYDWVVTKDVNKLSEKFGFKDAIFTEIISDVSYQESMSDYKIIVESFDKLKDIKNRNYLTEEENSQLWELCSKLKINSYNNAINQWIKVKSLYLEKFTIEKMKNLCQSKSGINQLPSNTGLLNTFNNCLTLYLKTKKIIEYLSKNSMTKKVKLGDLNEKGSIYLEKQIFLNPNEAKNVSIKKGSSFTISDLRVAYKKILDIHKHSFDFDKGNHISELNNLLLEKDINSLSDFVTVKGKIVKQNGEEYKPSSGEQSMLLLANALVDDSKNIFILDEPELSVGHKYINDVIVPRIIELSKLNKIIIISTHDANIGVRTLPLLSVYREYQGDNKYSTYIGSPFTDKLVNYFDERDCYNWTEKSMITLEGGENAFIERSEIYGK